MDLLHNQQNAQKKKFKLYKLIRRKIDKLENKLTARADAGER